MSREYVESARIRNIAERMIAEHHEHLKTASIAYVMKERDPEVKSKPAKALREGKQRKIAKARLVPQIYQLLSGHDFIVEVDELLWDFVDVAVQEAVIDHELCHCVMDKHGWYVRDHDVQEFTEILERHGLYHKKLAEFVVAHSQRDLPFEAAVNQ